MSGDICLQCGHRLSAHRDAQNHSISCWALLARHLALQSPQRPQVAQDVADGVADGADARVVANGFAQVARDVLQVRGR